MEKQQLQNIIETSSNEEVLSLAKAELQKLDLIEKAAEGDVVAKAMLLLKETVDKFKGTGTGAPVTGAVSREEVEKLLKEALKKEKISFDDLDPSIQAKLRGVAKYELSLVQPDLTKIITDKNLLSVLMEPRFQRLISDLKARNNVYLYGAAGTGKSYAAEQIAEILGWELYEVNCNQFTSPLDLIGGQTIDGYQKGKLEMAWENADQVGKKFDGAVLLLDELPKLDPNTAGVLNAALAKVKNIKPDGSRPTIQNGRGENITMGNIFIIATGNTKLNEASTEYEANFKQDLSLQDRFAGSTYRVLNNYDVEFNNVMKGFAFIWLYLVKLREAIEDAGVTNRAFVSMRLMMSMRNTYIVYRHADSQSVKKMTSTVQGVPVEEALESPKTLKEALDSFLDLFPDSYKEQLKKKSEYDKFLKTVEEKNEMPMDALDTEEEIKLGEKLVKENQEAQKRELE